MNTTLRFGAPTRRVIPGVILATALALGGCGDKDETGTTTVYSDIEDIESNAYDNLAWTGSDALCVAVSTGVDSDSECVERAAVGNNNIPSFTLDSSDDGITSATVTIFDLDGDPTVFALNDCVHDWGASDTVTVRIKMDIDEGSDLDGDGDNDFDGTFWWDEDYYCGNVVSPSDTGL